MEMWDSSEVGISSRSEYEINASTVQQFYGDSEDIFNIALEAVIAGCVTECTFDNDERKFVGTVNSFEGDPSYEVKIFVTDDFAIQSTCCECLKQMCHHVGALALHSGFTAPIFSRIPNETETANAVNAGGEVNNKNEIEFVDLKRVKKPDLVKESSITDHPASTIVNPSDSTDHVDPISIKKESIEPKQLKNKLHQTRQKRKQYVGYRKARKRRQLIQNIWNSRSKKDHQL